MDLLSRHRLDERARIDLAESEPPPAEAVTVSHRFRFRDLIACGIILIVGIVIGLAVIKPSRPAQSLPVVKSTILVEPGHWLDGMRGELERPTRTTMAISRRGDLIVYSAIAEKPGPQIKPILYLPRTDQMDAKPILGTEGGFGPFLSPDDRWVGFWADRKLMKIPVEGGVPTTLCDIVHPHGASWGKDNRIVFSLHNESGLCTISADGGKPEILTHPDKNRQESGHRLPTLHWVHRLPRTRTPK